MRSLVTFRCLQRILNYFSKVCGSLFNVIDRKNITKRWERHIDCLSKKIPIVNMGREGRATTNVNLDWEVSEERAEKRVMVQGKGMLLSRARSIGVPLP